MRSTLHVPLVFVGSILAGQCATNLLQLEYAALGDSYASGDGAGSSRLLPNLDIFCGRFSEAYPVQIASTTELNIGTFRNLACGGAFTTSVVKTQVPFITGSDIVTLQVGGNEMDFFVLLNECVHQWQPLSSCGDELTKARKLAESTAFLQNFDALVSTAKRTMKQDATLLILGYARFFNDSTTQCNDVSFSHSNPEMKLTTTLRQNLNALILVLNNVIRSTAESHGAAYVDIDSVFGSHRFCEEDVQEPDVEASWFFTDLPPSQQSRAFLQSSDRFQRFVPNPFRGFINYTRTFHPKGQAHGAISAEITRILQQ